MQRVNIGNVKRREFCQKMLIVGGSAILPPLLNACQSLRPLPPARPIDPTPAPTGTDVPPQVAQAADTAVPLSTATPAPAQQPTATPPSAADDDLAYVALVKTADRREGVRRALALLGVNPVDGRPVLLKPNFNSADPTPASTHPDVLQSLVLALQEMNARRITVGELHSSTYQRHMIAEINTAYTPALVVIDGVEAFVDGGPARGALAQPEVILAGTDRIALDAVGVAILRLFGATPAVSQGEIFEQTQIARAVELGLGVDSPTQIRFVTGDPESQAYADRISALL